MVRWNYNYNHYFLKHTPECRGIYVIVNFSILIFEYDGPTSPKKGFTNDSDCQHIGRARAKPQDQFSVDSLGKFILCRNK